MIVPVTASERDLRALNRRVIVSGCGGGPSSQQNSTP
jgi:hypothetical protein